MAFLHLGVHYLLPNRSSIHFANCKMSNHYYLHSYSPKEQRVYPQHHQLGCTLPKPVHSFLFPQPKVHSVSLIDLTILGTPGQSKLSYSQSNCFTSLSSPLPLPMTTSFPSRYPLNFTSLIEPLVNQTDQGIVFVGILAPLFMLLEVELIQLILIKFMGERLVAKWSHPFSFCKSTALQS